MSVTETAEVPTRMLFEKAAFEWREGGENSLRDGDGDYMTWKEAAEKVTWGHVNDVEVTEDYLIFSGSFTGSEIVEHIPATFDDPGDVVRRDRGIGWCLYVDVSEDGTWLAEVRGGPE